MRLKKCLQCPHLTSPRLLHQKQRSLFTRQPPSISPPPPDVPEAAVPPRPATPALMVRRFWSAQGAAASALQMPLRETQGPQNFASDGTLQEEGPIFYYQTFSMTDRLNWKHHTNLYSEKPQALVSLLEPIFLTHHPTWVDFQQLLLLEQEHLFLLQRSTDESCQRLRNGSRLMPQGVN